MEASSTNANGWHNSRGRQCCDAIVSMFPTTFQSIMKTFSVISATKGGTDSSGTTSQSGKLALLAEAEIFGAKTHSTSDEFNALTASSQLEYFKTTANRIKKVNGSANPWWERSPGYAYTSIFCRVANSGTAASDSASNSIGFAPFGVI